MPDRAPGGFGGAFRRGMFAGQNASSGQVHGEPGGNVAFGSCVAPVENTKHTSQYEVVRLPRVPECLRFAAFKAACTDSSRPRVGRPSIERQCRFEPAGIGGHDLLHHGDEALLIGLA
jgi:hypothetical protein